MSLSDVGLRKKISSLFNFREPSYTPNDLVKKQERCEELFEILHECVGNHGWND